MSRDKVNEPELACGANTGAARARETDGPNQNTDGAGESRGSGLCNSVKKLIRFG